MNDWLIIFVCGAAVLTGIAIGCFWERRYFNRRIQKLNLTLDRVMRGDLSPDWSPYQEGELSILANQLELIV